ncbi:MAG: ester cyclase [Candidatus Sulfotelmatobacter sp.]
MSEASLAVVRRVFDECLNRHNLDLYPELFSDVVYRAPALGELRNEEHRHLLLSVLAGFPDGRWTIEDQIAEKSRVVTRWSFTGTHTGMFMGIESTGRQVHITGICIDRIVKGKIVEEWEEGDTLGMMQQLALLPAGTNLRGSIPSSVSTVAEEWECSTRI